MHIRKMVNNELKIKSGIISRRAGSQSLCRYKAGEKPKLSTVTGLISQLHFVFIRFQFFYVMRIIRGATGTNFCQFAMKMNNPFTSGTLVQIVNVLCNNCHIEILLQSGKPDVPGIRLYIQ